MACNYFSLLLQYICLFDLTCCIISPLHSFLSALFVYCVQLMVPTYCSETVPHVLRGKQHACIILSGSRRDVGGWNQSATGAAASSSDMLDKTR